MADIRSQFLLDPEIAFLNHGSFGAMPMPVINALDGINRKIARNPVAFHDPGRAGASDFNQNAELARFRTLVGQIMHCGPDDIAGLGNASNALTAALTSLDLRPGDEIVTTNHEYGAVMKLLAFLERERGIRVRTAEIPASLRSAEEFTKPVLELFSPRTRAALLSVVTSPTALRLPVEPVVAEARKRGALSILDGAHVPGLIPFPLRGADPDIFAGNCHKWLMAANGAGFLYARHDIQHLIEPGIISNGWADASGNRAGPGPFGNSLFIDRLSFPGTSPVAPLLTLEPAVEFARSTGWAGLCEAAADALEAFAQDLAAEFGLPALAPKAFRPPQMAALNLGPGREDLQERLYSLHKIEVPVIPHEGSCFLRISCQPYNTSDDLARLREALRVEL